MHGANLEALKFFCVRVPAPSGERPLRRPGVTTTSREVSIETGLLKRAHLWLKKNKALDLKIRSRLKFSSQE